MTLVHPGTVSQKTGLKHFQPEIREKFKQYLRLRPVSGCLQKKRGKKNWKVQNDFIFSVLNVQRPEPRRS